MATTLKASTLKLTVREEITLNGVKYDHKKEKTISDINQIYHQTTRIGTSSQTILGWDNDNDVTVDSFGKVVNTKYVRITNLDDEHYVILTVKAGALANVYEHFKLEAGRSIIFNDLNLEQAETWAAWDYFTLISAKAYTAAVDLDIFVAGTQTFTGDDSSGG